ncbi:MAG TPA: GrdX family protein [Tissierellaceae bacterium]|nr:GrdX family protein [Tissierellaceae bacterium]
MTNTFKYNIVTNNPSVRDKYENTIFLEGSFKDVLLRVRDLVHTGSELVNHPLGASIRMFFSPYRSIIIKKGTGSDIEFHINTIENSIQTYDKQMESRDPDVENSEDYSFIDEELLNSALEEFKRMSN